MIVNIEFNTDNAAFEDNFLMEVTKTLTQAKEAILLSENRSGLIRRHLKDTNGNRIGVVTISHDVPDHKI